ncbi:Translin [Podospora aff. communis PSN243]|uniref:Translin n=1 Tax=Podospora aff. communis PSN243 TaxID=3040156 RepID=A0AAV9GNU6_9PEZI|nr:Translin [Podospora aff. communis PSN243]
MASPTPPSLIDPSLFDQLRARIDQDTAIRKDLEKIIDDLQQHVAYTQGLLSRIHSTPRAKYEGVLLPVVEEGVKREVAGVRVLGEFAGGLSYYKYSYKWNRTVQDAISTVLLTAWLGGLGTEERKGEVGRLLTLEEVGGVFGVPVNLKDEDKFHITIEDYLLGLVNIVDDLARLAMNSVTLGDTEMAVRISGFVKDLHAGFQVLNLKNDLLRKRVDSIKYAVKKVEDVVYDLSLRNLIPSKMEE